MQNNQTTEPERAGDNFTTEGAALNPTQTGIFTQDDVNRIVGERLTRERQKFELDLAEKEKELNEKEFRMKAERLFNEKKYPEEIMKAFNCTDIESLSKSIGIIEKYFNLKVGFSGYKPPNPGSSDIPAYDPNTEIRNAMGIKKE